MLLDGVDRESVAVALAVELVEILFRKGLELSGEDDKDNDDESRREEVGDADGWTVVALARNLEKVLVLLLLLK